MTTIRAAIVAALAIVSLYLAQILVTTGTVAMLSAWPLGSLLAGVDAVLNKESECD